MTYEADPELRRLDGGRIAIGGSPLAVMRLSASGAAELDRLLDGHEPTSAASHAFAARLVDRGLLVPRPARDDYGPQPSDVTVVVPARDRVDALDRALASLTKTDPPARIVVVDDASRDAAAIETVAAAHGAEVLRRAARGGPAAARNTGLAVVTTPWVAFVDSDVEVGEDWLSWLLPHGVDERIALVAPRVITPAPERDAGRWRRYETAGSPLDLGPRRGPVRARSRLSYVPAAALVCRTEAIRSIGGFDESLPVGEDVDLVWRLVDAEWRCWYVGDDAWVSHPARGDVYGGLRQRFDYGTSAAALDDLHPGNVAPVSVSGWSAALWAALALGRPRTAAVIAIGTTVALARRLDFLEHPGEEAARLAGRGHLGAGELLGRAVVRPWWPVALAGGLTSRRLRRLGIVAAVVPPLLEWRRSRPALDPVSFVICHVADDVAYSAGVWVGCRRRRSWGALAPTFPNWP